MTAVQGGLRQRLIKDSFYNLINDGLADLGWLTPSGTRKTVTMRAEPLRSDEEITVNSVIVSVDDLQETTLEMGTNGVVGEWVFYVDVYAENESLGVHLIGDVRAILSGRLASIGRDHSTLPVLDYRMATPSQIFYCELEDINVVRAQGYAKSWQRYWWSCQVTVVDEEEG